MDVRFPQTLANKAPRDVQHRHGKSPNLFAKRGGGLRHGLFTSITIGHGNTKTKPQGSALEGSTIKTCPLRLRRGIKSATCAAWTIYTGSNRLLPFQMGRAVSTGCLDALRENLRDLGNQGPGFKHFEPLSPGGEITRQTASRNGGCTLIWRWRRKNNAGQYEQQSSHKTVSKKCLKFSKSSLKRESIKRSCAPKCGQWSWPSATA